MSDYKIDWTEAAKQLLGKRDRYTDDLIRREFKPESDKIEIGTGRYVTPVADNRYVVVWDLDPVSSVASVRAVVPTQLRTDNPGDVKKQVSDVLRYESNGQFSLDE